MATVGSMMAGPARSASTRIEAVELQFCRLKKQSMPDRLMQEARSYGQAGQAMGEASQDESPKGLARSPPSVDCRGNGEWGSQDKALDLVMVVGRFKDTQVASRHVQ